mgnify:CR=1 FL=1
MDSYLECEQDVILELSRQAKRLLHIVKTWKEPWKIQTTCAILEHKRTMIQKGEAHIDVAVLCLWFGPVFRADVDPG